MNAAEIPIESADPALDVEGAGQRRCIVTGQVLPREQLVRFVLDEAGQVWPDSMEKLPGRGVWVGCTAVLLEQAVRKILFAKAFRRSVTVDPALTVTVSGILQGHLQNLLGLARKSGLTVQGLPQVLAAAQRRQLSLLLLATDAGQDGQDKLTPYFKAADVIQLLDSPSLGQALGRDQAVYVGLSPHRLTTALRVAAGRFSGFSIKENVALPARLEQIGAAKTGADSLGGGCRSPDEQCHEQY